MPLPTYTVVCTSKTPIAKGVYEFRLTKPEGFSFTPGQFILLQMPLVEKPEDIQPRALSIASTPEEKEFLFVLKLVPGGRMSRWVDKVMQVGTEVKFQGPFGNFVLNPGVSNDYLFIATGAGIAPFRPMIMSALQRGDGRKMDLIFGVHDEQDVFWKDWCDDTAKSYQNFSAHITLSQPSPSWTGHKGRVQTVAPAVVQNEFAGKSLYVCGNPDMTNDVKKLALEQWGMEKKDLHIEGYI